MSHQQIPKISGVEWLDDILTEHIPQGKRNKNFRKNLASAVDEKIEKLSTDFASRDKFLNLSKDIHKRRREKLLTNNDNDFIQQNVANLNQSLPNVQKKLMMEKSKKLENTLVQARFRKMEQDDFRNKMLVERVHKREEKHLRLNKRQKLAVMIHDENYQEVQMMWLVIVNLESRLDALKQMIRMRRFLRCLKKSRSEQALIIQRNWNAYVSRLEMARQRWASEVIRKSLFAARISALEKRRRKYSPIVGLFLQDIHRSGYIAGCIRTYRSYIITIQQHAKKVMARNVARFILIQRQFEIADTMIKDAYNKIQGQKKNRRRRRKMRQNHDEIVSVYQRYAETLEQSPIEISEDIKIVVCKNIFDEKRKNWLASFEKRKKEKLESLGAENHFTVYNYLKLTCILSDEERLTMIQTAYSLHENNILQENIQNALN
eukprot:TRINITY_DN3111_c0_g2_i1.p1 TRINITY_DN3111_c0_g2~~TRINITY_DN3111_c0_g2_i1.p1  ORF type:complete len:433 (+),score=109.50 TRINITY_DN3111_c0_g2_i1:271-1569(+)